MKFYLFLLLLIITLFSCQEEKDKFSNSHTIKVVEAHGHLVPQDSVQQPKTIPAGIPTIIKAGQPKFTLTNTNIHPAGTPTVIMAGKPRICTSGKFYAGQGRSDTFLLPKTVPAIDSPFVAGAPETVIAKDMANKDQNPQNFSTYGKLQGLKLAVIGSMLQDKNGNLWFGTGSSGVSKYDGKSFTHFTDKEGLSNNGVVSMLEDKSGNLWFGTNGGGVSKYDGKSFTHFTDKEGLANNIVRSILEDKSGNLWFGTNGGVSKYDGNRVDDIINGTNLYQHTQQDLKKNKKDLVKSFTTFTDKEGLPNNDVTSMLEDKSGNLWFGTYSGGVSKYDGNCIDDIINGTNLYQHTQQDLKKNKKDLVKSFTTFTNKEGLAHNAVLSILEDKSGNLWFGTNGGGVSKYDGNCVDDIINGTNLYQHTQQDLKKNKKDLVKSFATFTDKEGLSNNIVMFMLEDKSGNLWFGTSGGGVSKYDGNCIDDIINGTNLYQHTQQDLKKNKKGLVKSFTHFTDKEGLANNIVKSILEDKSGNLWFGTSGGGVSKYDGKSFTHFTDKEGLANNTVLSLLEDKSGNLWFGTYGGGVSKYDGKSFTTFTDKEGLANNTVLSMLEDKSGNLWFGTNGGVSKYDGNRVDDIINGTNLYQHTQQDLKKNKKDLVKSFTTFTDKEGLAHNTVWSILEDKSGNLWFGTGVGGVSKYDGNCVDDIINGTNLYQHTQQDLKKNKKDLVKSFTHFTDKEGLANNSVWSILEDKSGNLWFGTSGGGVSKLDSKYLQALSLAQKPTGLLPSFTTFTEKEGLANNTVRSILEDKSGNLWFGTNGGVSMYDGNCIDDIINGTNLYQHTQQDLKKNKKDLVKSFTTFTEKEGLANNTVSSLLEDKSGNLWFGTRFGICKLTSGKLVEISDKVKSNRLTKQDIIFKNYTYTDGFLGIGINAGKTILQATDGTIWIGANDRLTAMHTENMPPDTMAPNTQLTTIELFNENVAWSSLLKTSTPLSQVKDTVLTLGNGVSVSDFSFDGLTKWYTLPDNLSLAYNNNYLTFNFIGITTAQPQNVKYQYILEGIDENWSALTNKTSAPYGNLPYGNYTFKVKAMNSEGYWSKAFEYKFTIRPPFWQTWWFRTLVVLIIISSIWYYIKSREKKLVAEKIILEKTVEERTAEAVEQKDIAEQQKEIAEQQKHLVEEKHKEITDSINYAERIQRSFLATKEHLNSNLNEYFILFKPKDVVSGDFYWSGTLNNGLFALVTADSTGHGVPGAIMSLLNISGLEKAIETNTQPADILNSTRKTIIERLKKDGSSEGGKDGMDASLCVYDFKNKKLTIAAANNPVWIVRYEEGSVEPSVVEVKPDKMPIGKHDKDSISFTQQEIDLQPGDVIYTLTDGFPDQFGGPNGKKFMSKNLRELLAANAHLPMQEQKELLEKTFADWVGNMEQVDDVCLIGVKV